MRLTNATTSSKLQKTGNLPVRTSPVFGEEKASGKNIKDMVEEKHHQPVGKQALRVFTVQPGYRLCSCHVHFSQLWFITQIHTVYSSHISCSYSSVI